MKKYNTPHRSRVIKTRLTEEEYAEFSCQFTPSLAPMARYDLIATLWPWPDDAGGQDTTSGDTLHGFLHRFIIPHLEGMIFEGK